MNELWQLQSFAKMTVLEGVAEQTAGIDVAKCVVPVEPADSKPKTTEELAAEKAAKDALPVPLMTKLIVSLRRVDGTDWKEMFERVNAIEQVLRRDPCDAYASMDFESRDHYRKLISALAERSKATEQQVAEKIVELARPIQASPDAVQLDVCFLERPAEDPLLVSEVWKEVDDDGGIAHAYSSSANWPSCRLNTR